jgi:hypothetical protein
LLVVVIGRAVGQALERVESDQTHLGGADRSAGVVHAGQRRARVDAELEVVADWGGRAVGRHEAVQSAQVRAPQLLLGDERAVATPELDPQTRAGETRADRIRKP